LAVVLGLIMVECVRNRLVSLENRFERTWKCGTNSTDK
jgi:hypothetical protein